LAWDGLSSATKKITAFAIGLSVLYQLVAMSFFLLPDQNEALWKVYTQAFLHGGHHGTASVRFLMMATLFGLSYIFIRKFPPGNLISATDANRSANKTNPGPYSV